MKSRVMITNVYEDGFNLYNRAVKDTPYKWLDLSKLCRALVPSHHVRHIRYFTSLVHPRPNDPQAPVRQQVYLRALKTIPNLTIEFGQFRTRIKTRPLVTKDGGIGANVRVHDTEEKGTDVNLATYLLMDGFEGMPKELRDAATFSRRLYRSVLAKCLFPDTLQDEKGTIMKPGGW